MITVQYVQIISSVRSKISAIYLESIYLWICNLHGFPSLRSGPFLFPIAHQTNFMCSWKWNWMWTCPTWCGRIMRKMITATRTYVDTICRRIIKKSVWSVTDDIIYHIRIIPAMVFILRRKQPTHGKSKFQKLVRYSVHIFFGGKVQEQDRRT